MSAALRSGTKFAELVRNKWKRKTREDSIVCKMPCASCSKNYYGETKRVTAWTQN